jgi:hypothetical protein
MPQADFTGEYSANAGRSNFPKLKLQTNERARVVIVTKPNVEYVHWLEAPKIVNMAPKYTKISDREGNEQWVVDKRFVNRAICHGDFKILQERGVDPDCMACAKARDFPDIFRPPSPRYAATIIRYSMRPNGGWNDLSTPYAIGSLVWAFSGKIFDKLRSIMTMGEAYEDIRKVDLLLECTDGNYQKPYSQGDFTPIAPAYWMASSQIQDYTIQYLQQNCASEVDLNDAIGKQVKDDWLADDLLRITQAWDVVRAYESRQQGSPSLGQGFGAETFQTGMAAVQQQFGQPQNGFQPQQGNGFNGASPPPPPPQGNGFQPQSSQQLWEPQWQQPASAPPPPPPPAPSVPAPVGGDALTQAAGIDMSRLQAAQAAQFQQAGVPQSMLPDTLGGQVPPSQPAPQWQPPSNPQPSPTPQPTPSQAPPPPQQPPASPSAVPQSPQPIQRPGEGQAVQPIPNGLDGLNEYMKSTTSNPAPSPIPPPAQQLQPPAQPPAAAPTGGHYSFEDLVKLGKQN